MPDNDTTTALRQSRTTGYHNATSEISDDPGPPPSYATSTTRTRLPRTQSEPITSHLPEKLPPYSCSLIEAGPASVRYECTSPFEYNETNQWSDVFLVLHGTRFSVYQVATPKLFSKNRAPIGAGKHLKTYSLQHAEVGVASDCKKYELVSRSPVTAFLPQSMQEKMKETEPHLFEPVRQYILRLRVESDQILLRLKTWEERATWIEKLCAAIDIAPPIDERSEPKNHTLPRRRHRERQAGANQHSIRVRLDQLVEDQQRIIQERFPHLLLPARGEGEVSTSDNDRGDIAGDPDADDLDMDVLRGEEDVQDGEGDQEMMRVTTNHSARSARRQAGPSQAQIATQTYSTRTRPRIAPPLASTEQQPEELQRVATTSDKATTAEEESAKLAPTQQLDVSQDARYRRRCMPTLLANSRRATGIIYRDGKLWTPDYSTSSLKPYPAPPPSYSPSLLPSNAASDPSTPVELTNTTTAIDFLTHTNPPSSQPRLRNTKSSTTVNDSGGSSVDETTSTRLRLKDAMGTTWRKFKLRNGNGRKGETSSTEEVAEGDVVEEKMQAVAGAQPSATAAER